MFSQTLAHGNSKNELRYENRQRWYEERREYRKKHSRHETQSPDGLSHPNQTIIIIIIIDKILLYFIRYGKKYNKIQLTKNKMDLNNR